MEQLSQMPVVGWVALVAFFVFVGYKFYSSRNRPPGTGSSGGGDGGKTHNK